jgi:hypothetical protein
MNRAFGVAVATMAIGVGVGIGIGSAAASHTVIKTVAVTKDVNVPGPVTTKTVTVKVPGPVTTKTVYTPVTSAVPTGTTVMRYSGSGTQVTPAFPVPASGDYVVSWSFSGNGDGYGNGGNFIMAMPNADLLGMSLPNDIASGGSGSTEVAGDTNATDSFNVQAEDGSSWTVKVVAAP